MRKLILVISLAGLLLVKANEGYAADIEAVLEDNDGTSAFSVKDSSGSNEVAHIDSDGNMVIKGGMRLDAEGLECTTSENLIVDGSVGIGEASPASILTVGSGGPFQVDTSGDIIKLKNITYSWPSSQAAGSSYVLTNDGSGILSWSAPGSISASSSLSDITAATATNTIANANFAQTWNWDTLAAETAMALGSTSITSGKLLSLSSSATGFTGTMQDITLSGDNAANTGTLLKSTVSGANSAAVPLMITNAGTGLSFRVNDDGTDTDSSPVVVDASGNVGIGTTSPGYKLHVAGNIAMTSAGNTITTPATELVLEETGDSHGTVRLRLQNRSGMNGAMFENPSLDLVDFAFNPSSGAKQNIRYEHRSDKVYTGNSGGQFEIGPNDNENLFVGAGVSGFRSGNVGIGTTSPNQKLSVAGTLGILEGGSSPTYYTIFQGGDQSTDITYTLPTSAGSSGQVLTTDGTGVLSWTTAAGGGLPAGSSGQTLRHDGTNWVANSVLFNDGTNIGIGTTDPKTNLDVNGGIRVRGAASLPTASADLRGTIFTLQGGAGVDDKIYICAKTSSDTYQWILIGRGD